MKNLARFYLVLGLALILHINLARAAGGFHVVDLRCEYGAVSTGIDVPNPRLSWKLTSDKRGQRQTAYHIRVYSKASLARYPDTVSAETPDLWDSGKVVSDETLLIRYAGKKLESSQQVFWSVRVWDENDQPSATSDLRGWTMGLLKPEGASSAAVNGSVTCAEVETTTRPVAERMIASAMCFVVFMAEFLHPGFCRP